MFRDGLRWSCLSCPPADSEKTWREEQNIIYDFMKDSVPAARLRRQKKVSGQKKTLAFLGNNSYS